MISSRSDASDADVAGSHPDDTEGVHGSSSSVAEGAHLDCSAGFFCETMPIDLPHNVFEWDYWDPCNGGPFTYRGVIDFEPGYDYIIIGDIGYDGWVTAISGTEFGGVWVGISTDHSITSNGIHVLTAACI